MYKKIRDGMLEKHGKEYDYKKEIEQIRVNYEERIRKLRENESELQGKLD